MFSHLNFSTFLLFISFTLTHGKGVQHFKWVNSLRTKADLESFLSGDAKMARETLTLSEKSGSKVVVMGTGPDDGLSLNECLEILMERRSGREIVLEIAKDDVWEEAYAIFKKYKAETWISVSFPYFKGPQGPEPLLTDEFMPQIVTEWKEDLTNFQMSLGTTVGYDGPSKGYSEKDLFGISERFDNGRLSSVGKYDFFIDSYHISHTDVLFARQIVKFMKDVRFVEIRGNEETQDKVAIDGLMRFIEEIGIELCYLNVPEKLRKNILGKNNSTGGSAGQILVDQLALIGVLLLLKMLQ